MLYCVPEALKKQSGTAFVSMMVTKQASIFSSISPVTRTADTYHTSSLLEMSLIQWPIPMTWQAMSTEDKSTTSALCCWINARSPQSVGMGDCFSSLPRSTRQARTVVLMLWGGQTPAAMREKQPAHGQGTLPWWRTTIMHTTSGNNQKLPWFGSNPSSLMASPPSFSVALWVCEWDGRVL